MNPTRTVLLNFDSKLNNTGKDKRLTDGLSAVVQIGGTLWVANDESLSVERLSLDEIDKTGYWLTNDQQRFELRDFIDLPGGDKDEADVEGLAFAGGYLWLVGSHSLKRKNPKPDDNDAKTAEKLATLEEGDGNRYLLTRIPVEKDGGGPALAKKSGEGNAARLRGEKFGGEVQGKFGDELTQALREDEHLGPFMPIPPTK